MEWNEEGCGGVCVWVRVVVVFVCGVLAADGESGGERILERERAWEYGIFESERSGMESECFRENPVSPLS